MFRHTQKLLRNSIAMKLMVPNLNQEGVLYVTGSPGASSTWKMGLSDKSLKRALW